jgi:hypothetical protein
MSFQRRSIGVLGALVSLTALTEAAHAQAIINHTSGLVQLGVQQFGNLNQTGTVTSLGSSGTTVVGVRYLKPGAAGQLEYTGDGDPAEGWGVGFNGIFAGGANRNQFGSNGQSGLTAVGAFLSTASTASTTANTGTNGSAQLQVTHSFAPSVDANLYQVNVTITNIGTATANNVLYRRVMDWDISPTQFSEQVEIGGWPATALNASSNNGFNSVDTTSGLTGSFQNQNFSFATSGTSDQGAAFQFAFGNLPSSSSINFQIFYGGNNTRDLAIGSLGNVGAEVYSLAQPNPTTTPVTSQNYSVSIFGFKGVGGTVISVVAPEPGTISLLLMGLMGGAGFAAHRRK